MALPTLDGLEIDDLMYLVEHIDEFPPEEQVEIKKMVDTLGDRAHASSCADDLIAFCCHMQPDYKVGKHHRILADLLMEIAEGRKDRTGGVGKGVVDDLTINGRGHRSDCEDHTVDEPLVHLIKIELVEK